MTATPRRSQPATRRGLRRLAAPLIAFATVVALLIGAHLAGLSLLWFTSGSMSPTIVEGSVALARSVSPQEISAGDVLSIVVDGERVTHRVVSVTAGDVAAEVRMRGDANDAADPLPVLIDHGDLVLFSVPPLVLALLGAGALALLAWALLLRRRSRAGRLVRRTASAAVLALVASLAVAVPTTAYWTDQVTASSGLWQAGTVPTAGAIGCANGPADGLTATFPSSGARFSYAFTLTRADTGAQVGARRTIAATADPTVSAVIGATNWTASDITATGQVNFRLNIYPYVTSATAWTATTPSTLDVHFENNGTSIKCGFTPDTSTFVSITSISSDSGSSTSDFITNVAGQTITGTGEPGATVVVRAGTTVIGTVTVTPAGTWSLPGVTLTEGAVTYTATATDLANNTATATRAIRLDTIAPVVTQQAATCTTNGNQVAGQPTGTLWCRMTSRGWTMTATDTNGSGVATQQYTNAGSAWTNYVGTVQMAELAARTMQARATDVAGNTSAIATGTYWIDGTAPVVTLQYPTGGLLASVLVQLVGTQCGANATSCGTIVDPISGPATATYTLRRSLDPTVLLARYCFNGSSYVNQATCPSLQVTINGTSWTGVGSASGAFPLSLLNTYTWAITATDRAGNTATTTDSRSTIG